jgi:hypothetical protein
LNDCSNAGVSQTSETDSPQQTFSSGEPMGGQQTLTPTENKNGDEGNNIWLIIVILILLIIPLSLLIVVGLFRKSKPKAETNAESNKLEVKKSGIGANTRTVASNSPNARTIKTPTTSAKPSNPKALFTKSSMNKK